MNIMDSLEILTDGQCNFYPKMVEHIVPDRLDEYEAIANDTTLKKIKQSSSPQHLLTNEQLTLK
jgi:hypothetical protein